jgi:antitoxin HigA-1
MAHPCGRFFDRTAVCWAVRLPVTATAAHLAISRVALSRVLNGRAGISPDLALQLANALGTPADFWLTMQAKDDLWQAAKGRRKKIETLQQSAA